jgi:hypothetical protein
MRPGMRNKMKTALRWGLSILVFLLGATMLYVSRMDMLVARGSDSMVSVFRPPSWAQLLAVLTLPIATFAALRPKGNGRWGRAFRVALLSMALLAYGFSLHAVSLDARDGSVNDVWGIWTVRSLFISDEGFPRAAFSMQPFMLSVHGDKGERLNVFLGVPPWNINGESILADPGLLPAENSD